MVKIIFCLVLCYFNLSKAENNVCLKYFSYWFKEKSSKCWHDSDVFATPQEKVLRYGFAFEKYEVISEDGYIISLFRIPNNGTQSSKSRPVVLLVPALISDSNFYFGLGNESIGFIFSKKGYDVWFINPRGTTYSQGHVKYTISDKDYWAFGFHEMGFFDLPATIDFIYSRTGNNTKIKLIGHSVGAVASFVYASLKSDHAKTHLQSIISLAPSIFPDKNSLLLTAAAPFNQIIWEIISATNAKHPFVCSWDPTLPAGCSGLCRLVEMAEKDMKKVLNLLHLYGTSPYLNGVYAALHTFCSKYPAMRLCIYGAYTITGYEEKKDYPHRIPVFFSVWPEHTSFQTLIHVLQLHHPDDKFRLIDYGYSRNLIIYNQSTPPDYPLDLINVPVHLFYGTNDLVAGKKSTETLLHRLKTTNKTITSIKNFAHLNYAMTSEAVELYYKLVRL